MGRWQAAILVEASPRFGHDRAAQGHAALGFGLEEQQATRLRVLLDTDYVVAAHRHVAMVLPTQPLDRHLIAALCRDPFGGQDLTEVSGADRFARWQFA